MIEVTGNLWESGADVFVITTNGTVKKNGECVMGRGCAAEAKRLYPGLPKLLGDAIREFGNLPHFFNLPHEILTLPVKYHWDERANIDLIERGCHYIRLAALMQPWRTIVMPRPGCGNGGLIWADVRPVVAPLLTPDNIHVIDFGPKL